MLEILHTVLLLPCEGRENLPPKAAEARRGPCTAGHKHAAHARRPHRWGRGIAPRPGAAPGPLPERRGCWKAIDSFWQRQKGKYFDHVTPHKRTSSLRVCNLHRRATGPGPRRPPESVPAFPVPASRQGNASIRQKSQQHPQIPARSTATTRPAPRRYLPHRSWPFCLQEGRIFKYK